MKLNPARALAALALLLSFLTPAPAQQQQPTTTDAPATLTMPQLRRPVTVRRDERGIPYIEAETDEDLFFMQGYVTASDRLWQMDLLRRNARGELAEVLGSAALEEDKRHRTLGYARLAEEAAARASPQARAAVEAYARGVNALIDSLDDKSLPPEFQILRYRPRHWTPADTHVVGKNFAEALSTTWRTDLTRAGLSDLPPERLRELLPVESPQMDVLVVGSDAPAARPKQKASVGPAVDDVTDRAALLRALSEEESVMRRSQERLGLHAEDLAASNNWVVAGRHTASGKPLLANDPHLAPSAPPIWYMVHLSAPGLRVAGVAAPGGPGVIIGHNERIAWGMTNLGPDVQDLYREKFDPADRTRYQTPSGWQKADVRQEEIKVRKGFADTATSTVTIEVTTTRHGPVVFEQDGARYALRWTALDQSAAEFDAFALLNRARNWDDFSRALSRYEGPTQNFVYADVEGHIGYYGAGRIPVRKTGDGSVPYDGATDAGEWAGRIPFAELPHVLDPPSGVIVTANSRVVGRDYRHFLTNLWAAPHRSRRIFYMLTHKIENRQKLTAADFREIQGDTFSIAGDSFARQTVRLARDAGLQGSGPAWAETIALLDNWDGRLEPDSRAALLAGELRTVFLRKVLEGAVGAERAREFRWGNSATFVEWLLREQPARWLPQGLTTYAAVLDASLKEARASLAKKYGEDSTQWTWGREFQVRFPHPLGVVPFVGKQFVIEPFPQRGGGGGFASVNVGSPVSMRLIADASDWDRTQHGIALGVSGLPSSPHYRDQLTDWQNVTPRAFPFTPAAVKAAAKETRVYVPAGKN